jgi:hypothetical protein
MLSPSSPDLGDAAPLCGLDVCVDCAPVLRDCTLGFSLPAGGFVAYLPRSVQHENRVRAQQFLTAEQASATRRDCATMA